MKHIQIAIDGPSGSGKSTLAKAVAKRFGIVYVDTGALYRTIGLAAKRRGIAGTDRTAVCAMLPYIRIELVYRDGVQAVLLDGEDVSGEIRTGEISMYASNVSAIPEVRSYLLDTQRNIAATHSVVMDGRDIGTVILPNADLKFFLVADDETRARRRYLELTEKGASTTYEEVLADMRLRDKQDASRDIAPAVAAPDTEKLDNSNLTIEQTLELIAPRIEALL